MSADEMFEKEGYVEKGENIYVYTGEYFEHRIKFEDDGESKTVICDTRSLEGCYEWDWFPKYIDMEELRAINKKCEELKWI